MTIFKQTFANFLEHKARLKVINVASCNRELKPNAAAKMLIDVVAPNAIFFLDYKFTQTYSNIMANPKLGVSYMDDDNFTGYRLTGTCTVLESGSEFNAAQKRWEKLLISYEADRMLKRMRGDYSTRDAENKLPKDFVIVKFLAAESAVIKPDRVFRSKAGPESESSD